MLGIKNIIFDLGGVILNLDNKRTEEAFAKMGVKNLRQSFGLGHADSFFKDYEVGKITDQQFVDSIRTMGGLDGVTDQEIVDGWNALLLDFPLERIELLKVLGKRYRIFLFSNTNSLHLAALRSIYTQAYGPGALDDFFEKTYYSHLLGMRKPEKESYEYILKENQLEGQETLFVDDAIVNVEGAEHAGLKGLYLRPGISLLDFQW